LDGVFEGVPILTVLTWSRSRAPSGDVRNSAATLLMVYSSNVADLSGVGVMSLSMHVESELVGEMFGGLALHSRSATWRGRNKAHPVVFTPLCTTQRIVDLVVYPSKANNLHYALPFALTAGGEGDVALRTPPSSVEDAITQLPTFANKHHLQRLRCSRRMSA
jgi:hypothetical protein